MEEISKDIFYKNLKCYQEFRKDIANCLNTETIVFRSIFDGHVYWAKRYKSDNCIKRVTVAEMFFNTLDLFNIPTDALSNSVFILFDKRYKSGIVDLLNKHKIGRFILDDIYSSYEVCGDE